MIAKLKIILKKILPRKIYYYIHKKRVKKRYVNFVVPQFSSFDEIYLYSKEKNNRFVETLKKNILELNYKIIIANSIKNKRNCLYFIFLENIKILKLPKNYILIVNPNSKKKFLHKIILKKALAIIAQSISDFKFSEKQNFNFKSFYYPIKNLPDNKDANSLLNIDIKNKELFYISRLLFYFNSISFDLFLKVNCESIKIKTNKICLALPESISRIESFKNENKYNFQIFPGLKRSNSWHGCAYSYKFMSSVLLKTKFNTITICEDDVHFEKTFERNYSSLIRLVKTNKKIDYLNCYCVSFNNKNQVHKIMNIDNLYLIKVNDCLSMVFNIYTKKVISIISKWNINSKATIDAFLSKHKLNVYIAYPFLVMHKDELNSTIWNNFNNKVLYNESLNTSIKNINKILNS